MEELQKLIQKQNSMKGETIRLAQGFTDFKLGKKIGLALLLSILVGEVLVMLLIPRMQIQLYWIEAVFDASLLTILIFPSVYFFVIRPMKIHTNMRERMEEEIILKNEQLNIANIDKDRFISILAHDLKSPFNVILGFSKLLKENIHQYDIGKIENLVNHINTSTQNTFNLLKEIIMWV